MELGVYSFAERISDPHTGTTLTPQQRIDELIEEIELADQVGLDLYGAPQRWHGSPSRP